MKKKSEKTGTKINSALGGKNIPMYGSHPQVGHVVSPFPNRRERRKRMRQLKKKNK